MNDQLSDDIDSRRRSFLRGSMACVAGCALSGVGPVVQASGKAQDRLIVNALGDFDDPNLDLARPFGGLPDDSHPDFDERVIRDARASGLNAVNITLGYVAGPQEQYEYTIRTIAAWDRILRNHPNDLLRVERADDIERARAQGKIGIIYGFQNAVQVGDRADRISTFADLGVRVVQLTYNSGNTLGDGCMAKDNRGLTEFGHAVVAQLNQDHVMVDLSHSGERTCLDAIAASRQPVSINHTGCRALADLPRNKTDAELRAVAAAGGFIGIYFISFLRRTGNATADDVVAHLMHAWNVCGEDHVGIGTDGSVTPIDDLGAYRERLAQEYAARVKAGIAAAGEQPDTYPFVEDLRGVDQFHKLERMLVAKGLTSAQLDKLFGLNFVSYARTIWG